MSHDDIVSRYVHLDRAAKRPLYLQVNDGLAGAIADGHFQSGRIPSTRYLAQLLEVGVNTINLAYQELEADGLIIASQRSGWFVNAELLQQSPTSNVPAPADQSGRWAARLITTKTPGNPPEVKRSAGDSSLTYPFITASLPREIFPEASWLKASSAAFEGESRTYSLYDNFGADDPFLIEMILERILPARGISAGPENILLTAGTQHALHLTAQALMSADTKVAFENPGYPDARHAFLRAGAQLCPVAVDQDGMKVEEIPADVDCVYVTPSHQLPSNVSMSKPRKDRLFQMASERGSLILEDDYESEMRFVGNSSTPLAARGLGNVAYVSGFSKYLGAICRVAYIVGPQPLIETLKDIRRYQIRNLSGHEQRTLAHFIANGNYEKQIRRLRRIAKRRWLSIGNVLEEVLPDWSVAPSAGGLHLWVKAPEGVDTQLLAKEMREHGVAIEPGHVFFVRAEDGRRYMKLGFILLDEAQQRTGLQILSEVSAI